MIIGKVTGNVVSTIKHDILAGHRLLIVKPVDPSGKVTGKPMIALDTVQAGEGDTVLVLDEGNSARLIINRKDAPVRTMIVGIVDSITGKF